MNKTKLNIINDIKLNIPTTNKIRRKNDEYNIYIY